jgi:hypothetical protein
MVHYAPDAPPAAHTPPPVCPKCGSHRTQIVGSSEGGVLTIRCNSCGERSTISVGARETVPSGDDVATDLAVMRGVGQPLGRLPDAESRTRVLRWTTDQLTP